MKLRKLILIVLAAIVTIGLLASCSSTKVTVHLLVNGPDGGICDQQITVTQKDPTVLDVLIQYTSSQDIEFSTEANGSNIFISSIDNVNSKMGSAPAAADSTGDLTATGTVGGTDYSQYYWNISVNGTAATTSAGQTAVADGDTVELDFILYVDTTTTTAK